MSIVLSAERKAGVEIDDPASLQSDTWCFWRSDYEPYLILQRGSRKRHLSVQCGCQYGDKRATENTCDTLSHLPPIFNSANRRLSTTLRTAAALMQAFLTTTIILRKLIELLLLIGVRKGIRSYSFY